MTHRYWNTNTMTRSMSLADIDTTKLGNFAWGGKVATNVVISSIPGL